MTGRPHILVAHPSADLYGSDRVLLESIAALRARGATVTVTLPETGALVERITLLDAQVVICPTPVLRKSVRSPRGLGRFGIDTVRGILHGIRLLRAERPAAIYVNTLTVPLWLPLARIMRIPSICHVHEAEGNASRIVRVLMTAPLLLATRVIANSEYSVKVLQSAIPRVAAAASVVYNAVPGPPENAVDARPELEDGVRLVYVGRLSPRKGADVAIDAVLALQRRGIPARLDMVGSVFRGYEWYERELRTMASQAGTVRFLGFQESIWDTLSAADVAVVPSRYDEPFGNTAVEAILARRPVVVSATSGLREATAGYRAAHAVLPSNPEAIADAVGEIVSAWSAARTAASQDRELALDRHSAVRYGAAITALVWGILPSGTAQKRRPQSLSGSGNSNALRIRFRTPPMRG